MIKMKKRLLIMYMYAHRGSYLLTSSLIGDCDYEYHGKYAVRVPRGYSVLYGEDEHDYIIRDVDRHDGNYAAAWRAKDAVIFRIGDTPATCDKMIMAGIYMYPAKAAWGKCRALD